MDEDFIANFEDEHGWTPDCAYDIIGEENIGGKSVKLSHEIFPMGALAVLGALEGKTAEEMAQSLLEEEENLRKERNER